MRGEGPPARLTNSKPVVITKSPDREWRPPVYGRFLQQGRPVRSSSSQNRCVCIAPDADELESYKVLRTRIQQAMKPKGWNTILVTSPNPGDGKTLTAINLALTFAKAYNQTVMLVDCDLRRQSIHRVLGLESEAGIVDLPDRRQAAEGVHHLARDREADPDLGGRSDPEQRRGARLGAHEARSSRS